KICGALRRRKQFSLITDQGSNWVTGYRWQVTGAFHGSLPFQYWSVDSVRGAAVALRSTVNEQRTTVRRDKALVFSGDIPARQGNRSSR
ncbi:MAG: hypothetical protein ACYDBH_23665, partial [Acidobacteriaceae bacterium]